MKDLHGRETGFDNPDVALHELVMEDIDERVERKVRMLFGDGVDGQQMRHMLRAGLYHARWDDERNDAVFWMDEEVAALMREQLGGT